MRPVNKLECRKVERGQVHEAHVWRGYSAAHRCPGLLADSMGAPVLALSTERDQFNKPCCGGLFHHTSNCREA